MLSKARFYIVINTSELTPDSRGCNAFPVNISCMYYAYKPSERYRLFYGENRVTSNVWLRKSRRTDAASKLILRNHNVDIILKRQQLYRLTFRYP